MIIVTTKEEFYRLANFTPQNKTDEKRGEEAYWTYCIELDRKNPAALCDAMEILQRRPGSRRLEVTRPKQEGHGCPDSYTLIDGKYIATEVKNNYGRIDDIKDKYVVYTLFMSNSTGTCVIAPRIMKRDTFFRGLEECKAIKTINKNGILDGHGVQASKRTWWRFLEEQTYYYHEKAYTSEEIL